VLSSARRGCLLLLKILHRFHGIPSSLLTLLAGLALFRGIVFVFVFILRLRAEIRESAL